MRYLLCFIPPLAILSCGKPFQFLFSIILTLCFYFPGVIHAFAVVATYNADRRQQKLINALKETHYHA